jgi:transposase InsO family protein
VFQSGVVQLQVSDLSALEVAKIYLQEVYWLYWLPKTWISDCDYTFLSTLWKELSRLADVQLSMSSSYHPQTNGQTERVNQRMETFLWCFVNDCPSKWFDWVFLAIFSTILVGTQLSSLPHLRCSVVILQDSLG